MAGIDLESQQWIRPVGRLNGRLTTNDVTIVGSRKQIRPFDTVMLNVGDVSPEVGQPENAPSIDGIQMFQKLPVGFNQEPSTNLRKFLHDKTTLFQLAGKKNDRVAHKQLAENSLTNSLALLLLSDPEFVSEPEGRWRMKVPYGSKVHSLRVTDPVFRDRVKNGGRWVICVSLGSVFQKSHYGLVAMAMPLDQVPTGYSFAPPLATPSVVVSKSDVYIALKAWRRKKMHETKRPAYTFFHDQTLEEMARKLPSSRNELLEVFGMGPIRVQEFGDEILDVILRNRTP